MDDHLKEKMFTAEAMSRNIKNARITSLSHSAAFSMVALTERGYTFCRVANTKSMLLVGSHPVLKFTPPNRTKLNDPDVEIWLALSHDVVICNSGSPSPERFALLEQPDVTKLNEIAFHESNEIAAGSKSMIESFAKRYRKSIK